MTSQVQTGAAPTTRHTLRLRLKPKASVAGCVGGGWWPRSRDLATEVLALAEVLAVRLGPVSRISYALPAWDLAPDHVDTDGQTVRLEGFRTQEAHTVHVTGANGRRVSLLVVPPEMPGDAAHTAMMAAAARTNTDRPDRILTAAGIPARDFTTGAAAAQRIFAIEPGSPAKGIS